jgi:hypothetical protein
MSIVALSCTPIEILHLSMSFPYHPAWEPEMENNGVVTLDGNGHSAIVDIKSMRK